MSKNEGEMIHALPCARVGGGGWQSRPRIVDLEQSFVRNLGGLKKKIGMLAAVCGGRLGCGRARAREWRAARAGEDASKTGRKRESDLRGATDLRRISDIQSMTKTLKYRHHRLPTPHNFLSNSLHPYSTRKCR